MAVCVCVCVRMGVCVKTFTSFRACTTPASHQCPWLSEAQLNTHKSPESRRGKGAPWRCCLFLLTLDSDSPAPLCTLEMPAWVQKIPEQRQFSLALGCSGAPS